MRNEVPVKEKILVTGGCGYIGSHTIIDLLNDGFDVISVDDNSRSEIAAIQRVEEITGKPVTNYCINLCNAEDVKNIFSQNPDIKGVIHFGAFKLVSESVEKPLLYYQNNINSLINVLASIRDFNVPYFVFSSSCSVYGNLEKLPVTEATPLQKPESPYANTKQIGEEIILDFVKTQRAQAIILRYFNPAGAHESGKNGELPLGKPENLIPVITQFAIGKLPELIVKGTDYATRDGTCIRDYIHVMDIAHAHTKAVKYLIERKNSGNYEVFNLGSGDGVSVLEAIQAFESATGVKVKYKTGPRRPGDVMAIYADNSIARDKLGWAPLRSIEEMMLSAWNWEQNLKYQMSSKTGKLKRQTDSSLKEDY